MYQVPYLLNFAVPLLANYAFCESIDIEDTATTSCLKSSSNFSVRKKGKHAILTQKPTSFSDKHASALKSFKKSDVAKLKLLESASAPQRENDLRDVLDKYKVRLRVARENWKNLKRKIETLLRVHATLSTLFSSMTELYNRAHTSRNFAVVSKPVVKFLLRTAHFVCN